MMKYLFVIFLVSFSLLSQGGDREEEKKQRLDAARAAVSNQYRALINSGVGATDVQIEAFYLLMERYYILLSEPDDKQITQLVQMMNRISGGDGARYLERYRARRAEVERGRSERRSLSRIDREDPFGVSYPTADILSRVLRDMNVAEKSKAKNSERLHRALAMLLRQLAIGNSDFLAVAEGIPVLAAEEAAKVLYDWFQSITAKQFPRTLAAQKKMEALPDELIADQVRLFLVRYQALRTFAEVPGNSALRANLEAIRGELTESEVFAALRERVANLLHRLGHSQSRRGSMMQSRVGSTNTHFSHGSDYNSVRRERAPERQNPERQNPEAEEAEAVTESILAMRVAVMVDGTFILVTPEEVLGDGNCGFYALDTTRDRFVAQVEAAPNATRALVQALLDIEGVGYAEWLARIRQDGVWVSDLDLAIFAAVNNARVDIFHVGRRSQFEHLLTFGTGATVYRIATVGPLAETLHGPSARNHYIRLRLQEGRVQPVAAPAATALPAPTLAGLEAQFDASPNLINAQAIIDFFNASGETMSAELKAKLKAAGFAVSGRPGKYVVTQVDSTTRKNNGDDRDPPPPGGAAGGTGAGRDTETGERPAKKARGEKASKPAPKASHARGKKALEKILVEGATVLHEIHRRLVRVAS